jgi:hypothetical protein
MNDPLLLILIYAAFLAVTLFFRGRTLQGPWWFLLRSFLPNWRFYHRVGALPVMVVRALGPDGQWTDWHGDVPRARRTLIDLVHNPVNNRLLLDQSLIEHLYADLRDVSEAHALESLVSYRLACEIARHRALDAAPDARQLQFELRLIPPYGRASADTAVLTSPVIAIRLPRPQSA